MLAILSDGRIDDDALNDVRARAGLDDAWPPNDPRCVALGLLDADDGPDPELVPLSVVHDLVNALLDLAEHNAFEAGKAAAAESFEKSTDLMGRTKRLLSPHHTISAEGE